jgi:hypothetical protein
LATLLAVALGPARAQAQKIVMPGNLPEPKAVLDRPGTNLPWKVWVAFEGLAALAEARDGGKEIGTTKFQFMQPCFVAARHRPDPKGAAKYLLVARVAPNQRSIDRLLGWVHGDFVVQKPFALRDEKTTIHRKAMIVNRADALVNLKPLFQLNAGGLAAKLDARELPEELGKDFARAGRALSPKTEVEVRTLGDSWTVVDKVNRVRYSVYTEGGKLTVRDSLKVASVFDAPTETAAERTRYQLFNIFFVYAEARVKGKDYLLLGTDLSGNPEKVVQGWIPKERVSQWNTREALEWDRTSTLPGAKLRRGELGQVWASAQQAHTWLERKAEPKPLFREVFDDRRVSRAFLPEDMRFPVLEWTDPDFPRKHLGTGNVLLRVGWAGDFATVSGGKSTLDQEKVREYQQLFREAQEGLNRLEIVFVIDDTESMRPYLKATGQVVEAIIEEATKDAADKKRKVRVAVSYYNDVNTSDTKQLPYSVKPLVDVSDPKVRKKLIADARDHDYRAGGDELEQVFPGINAAVAGSECSPAARKLLIVIGDAGDKSADPDGNKQFDPKGVKTTKYWLDTLTKRLVPSGEQTPWELCVIHMDYVEPGKKRGFAGDLFETHLKALVDRVNAKSPERRAEFLPAREKTPEAVIARMKTLITKRFQELEEKAAKYDALLNQLRRGEWHTEIGPGLRDYLKRFGITEADLNRLRALEGAQIYQEGFIWQNGREVKGLTQVRPMTLLSSGELRRVVELLKNIVHPPEAGSEYTLQDLVERQLLSMLGEKSYKGQKIDEVFEKKLGLTFRTALLSRTPAELKDVKRSDILELEGPLLRLEDLLGDRKQKWELRTSVNKLSGEKETRWVADPKTLDERPRYFDIPGSSERWYWVDTLEELP